MAKFLAAAFCVKLLLSFVTWHPDVNNHVDWGIRFWQYGPANFYSPEANVWSFTWPNQPPGTIYIYAAIRKLFEAVFAFFWFLNIKIPPFPSNLMLFFETNLYPALLKMPGILADVGIGWLIYRVFAREDKEKIGLFGAVLFLANPVSWYNSTIWGQTDSLVSFFGLLAFIFLVERKLIWAVLSLAGSIYIKASLLLFLPVFALVLVKQKYRLKDIATAVGISLLFFGALTLPFSQGEPFSWLVHLYQKKVFTQQLQVITANAFNVWATLTGIHERPHDLLLGPLSFKLWGWLMFAAASLPALHLVYKKQDKFSVFWSLAIISFSAFMLLTNMHERYLYPLFPVLTILVVTNRKLLLLYVLVSAIHLLNLYNFWWYPRVNILIQVMSAADRLLPRVLGLVNLILFFVVYKSFVGRSTKFV